MELRKRTRLVGDGVEDMERDHCVEGLVRERQFVHVHLKPDLGVVDVDRDALDALAHEQGLQRAVGRDLE